MLRFGVIIFFLTAPFLSVLAQNDNVQTDSARFYKKVQDFSDKRRFTKFVYLLIFRPVSRSDDPPPAPEVKKQYFSPYEGKVIRNIRIDTRDPFGYGGSDTSGRGGNIFERTGNYLHVQSFPITIRNRLIFKEHDTFDSLRVIESMRLIRNQNYIREVFVYPFIVKGTDSVDILVRTVDVWSVIASGTASVSSFSVSVREKNFLGLGHQVQDDYSLDHSNGNFHNSTDYYFSNIFNTYINAVVHYDINRQREYNASCNVDRPFYSIFTKWAGGAYVLDHLNKIKMKGSDSAEYSQNIRYLQQDYWLGKSWQLFKGKREEERTTSLILAGRTYMKTYSERVSPELDTALQYQNEIFYLSSLGLVKRKYRQDSYVYKFGYTEDVPTGRAFSFILGQQQLGSVRRWYYGVKSYWGNYYRWGYFSANMEFGTFYRRSPLESCLTGGMTYFTKIYHLGNWRFRQFIKPQVTIGFNRSKKDQLTLSDNNGIHGFNGVGLSGNQKLLFSLQTQFYSPWDILGFRLGPYFVCSGGMLGTERSGFRRSPLYMQFGIGFLIKNDFLIMNSFEISVAYFPYIPGVGEHVFKENPFHSTDFGFRDSDVGKPSIVSYH
ncbi:MAG: hypothetical protein ACJ77K_09080 [Bacteroidia bacterium]